MMKLTINNNNYDLSQPLDISIGMHSGYGQVNAFHAPPFRMTPVREGDFVGSTKLGGPVNFMNFQCNPHGNGTHTECVGHISKEDYYAPQTIKDFFYEAELISVYPTLLDDGDRVIDESHITEFKSRENTTGLIIRTLPNDESKKERNYSGTNPPYLTTDAMHKIKALGIKHLLVDIPSVDRESDEGKLSCHKIFWNFDANIWTDHSITELIYVDDKIKDGIYLVSNTIVDLRLDAVPSRPILYPRIQ